MDGLGSTFLVKSQTSSTEMAYEPSATDRRRCKRTEKLLVLNFRHCPKSVSPGQSGSPARFPPTRSSVPARIHSLGSRRQ